MVDAPAGPDSSLAAQCVRALLERNGVPKHKHSATVTEVLGLSYSAGKRRLTSNAPWTLEELSALAENYGETLTDLIALGDENVVEATVVLDSHAYPCRIVRGKILQPPHPGALVAIQEGSAWRVVVATPALSLPAHDVSRLIVQSAKTTRRVAVLEDHTDTAATIVEYLRSLGMRAESFDSLATLGSAGEFDAYILDWIIERPNHRETAQDLIRMIRARDVLCPIVVLTGQMRDGGVDEQDIATAMARYNLKFFEKPASMPIIVAALNSAFKP